MDEYEKTMKVQYDALDKIDFEPYFEKFKGKEVYDLMDAVEDDYLDSPITKNNVLDGWIFNYLSRVEFIEYLEERYKGKFKAFEVTHYLFDYKK